MWANRNHHYSYVRQLRVLRTTFDITSLVLALSFFITPFAPLAYAQVDTTDEQVSPEQPSTDFGANSLTSPGNDNQTKSVPTDDTPVVTTLDQRSFDPLIAPAELAQEQQGEHAMTQSSFTSGTGGSGSEAGGTYHPSLEGGGIRVNGQGVFEYSYPLSIPPGRGEVVPELSISYNSNSRSNENMFGLGWEISIPTIERVNRKGLGTIYTEYEFRSSIDGDLVAISTSTSGTSTFRAKVENGSFLQYTLSDNTWRVTDKKGVVYSFGLTTNSRQDDPNNSSHVAKWTLEEIRDPNGNYATYTYYKNQGQIYPDSITYTHHSVGGTGPFTIQFTREARSDSYTSYAAGFKVVTDYRISEIQVQQSSVWMHKYEFDYGIGHNGTRSLLTSITETGKDAANNTVTLPPTQFSYSTYASPNKSWATTTWDVPLPIVTDHRSYDNGVWLFDVNGDSLTDLVQSKRNVPNSTSTLIENVYINDGDEWVEQNSTWNPPSPDYWGFITGSIDGNVDLGARIIDLNGDAKPDVLWHFNGYINGPGAVTIDKRFIHTGSGWTESNDWSSSYNFSTGALGDTGARLGDIDGNGLTDIVLAYEGGGQGTLINDGSGWVSASATWTPPISFVNSADLGARLADVNGDGLDDFVYGYDDDYQNATSGVYINTGSGWQYDGTWAVPQLFTYAGRDLGSRLVDINGDGLVDFVNHTEGGYTAYINTGSDWVYDDDWSEPSGMYFSYTYGPLYGTYWSADAGVRFAELNGDGLVDMVKYGTSEYNGDEIEQVVLHNGVVPDLLVSVDYSSSGSTDVTYKSSAQYKDENNKLLNPSLPYTIQTVERLTLNPGVGATSTTSYTYGGGIFYAKSPIDRRFAGFASSTSVDGLGNVTKTFYHQTGSSTQSSLGELNDDISKSGKPYRTEEYDSNGNLYQLTIQKWDRSELGQGSSFVKLATTTTLTYDGDGDHKDKAEEYTYDNTYGNLTKKTEYGEVTANTDGTFSDTGTDKRTTDIMYAASNTPYIVGLPKQETLKNNTGSTVADTKYYYDTLAHGSMGKGNLTKTEQWVSGSTWIDTEKSYNSYGLVTQEKDPRDKTTTYTYDAYNLYPATTTNPLGHSVYRQYDYSSGKVATTTDQNNLTYVTVYNGLDRPITEKQPDLTTPTTLVTKSAYEYVNTKSETKVKHTNYLDSATTTEMYQYFDGLGRLIQTRAEAESANTFAVADRLYNERGELKKETLPYFSTGSASTTATTTAALYSSYTYDTLGRPKTIANAVGTTSYAYDQWETVVTDANGNQKDLHHDALGHLTTVEEHNGASTYTTTYGYDAHNNLTAITDALSNIRAFTYDGLSRRTKAEDLHASGDSTFGVYHYAYDAAGNVSSSTNPNGQAINYTYDDLNRPLTEDYLGASGTEGAYAYDTCTYGKGKLCIATSTGAVTSYTYDPLMRTATETRKVATTTYATGFVYDRQGNLTDLTYPDLAQVRYLYNTAGQLEAIDKKERGGNYTPVVTDIDYGPHGKPTFKAYANLTQSTYTYDAAKLYRLSNLRTEYLGGQGGASDMLAPEEALLLALDASSTEPAVIEDTLELTSPVSTTTPDTTATTTTETATTTLDIETPAASITPVQETASTTPPIQPEESATPTPSEAVASTTLATTTEPVLPIDDAPFLTDGLIESVHDARAWRAYHKERVQHLKGAQNISPCVRISVASNFH